MKSAVEYLCVFPSIFIKSGRKFSFRNRMFSYLIAPLTMRSFSFNNLSMLFKIFCAFVHSSVTNVHYHKLNKNRKA